ncbi:hypothetical protein GVX82_02280 [Patescibacteria group bacterium]|jgi:hypothetical protein|nr:hypothetical protein [Patescibacteria group bacterium]
MNDQQTLVYSFPLYKRLALFCGALLFVGMAYLLFISEAYIFALLPLLFSLFVIYKLVTIPRTVLTVTYEGIIPHAVLKRGSDVVIPWRLISNIYVAIQRTRSSSSMSIAVQLHDTELLDQHQTSMQNVLDALNSVVKSQMSDRSGGDIYIPAIMLNRSAETIIEEITQFRSRHNV